MERSIDGLISSYIGGKLTRRGFLAAALALGLSVGGAAELLAELEPSYASEATWRRE